MPDADAPSQAQQLAHEMEAIEKEIVEREKKLTELKRRSGRGPVEDYELTGPEGVKVRLSELFGDRKDLIVIQNMGKT
jgi:predicted dithiol-disulfide oxidoreductase (DUF899 family)